MNPAAITDLGLPAGFTARPIDTGTDVEAITELCVAAAVAEYGMADLDLQQVRESYNAPGFNPQTDGLLVIDPEGRFGGVGEYYDNEANHVAPFVYVRVRPDLLESGIAGALLAWAERRGQATVAIAAPDLKVSLHTNASGVNRLQQQAIERSGWILERIFWEMEIGLGEDSLVVPPPPSGIIIRPAVAGHDERAAHAVEVEAFADHYGYLPRSFDEWFAFATRLYPYDPSLWFLATDGDEVVGMALCLLEAPGRHELGWVSTLGIRRAWRGRGLGLTLLKHAFAELHLRGKRQVGLGVDSESLTGATRLYERAGMQVARDSRAYERVLREGREIRPS